MEAAGSVVPAGTGWTLASESSIFSVACRLEDARVVAGIRWRPGEERPDCSPAKALIFTKGFCRLLCLGRPGAGGLRLAARGFSSEPNFEREGCCGGHSP